jgi:hypothetical protein
MKNKNLTLQGIRTTLIQAVGQLDLRGTNQSITEALCIIDAVIDSSISGKPISADRAFLFGKAMAATSEPD